MRSPSSWGRRIRPDLRDLPTPAFRPAKLARGHPGAAQWARPRQAPGTETYAA